MTNVHVAVVHYPGQVHIDPVLQVAEMLASMGVKVTVATTKNTVNTIVAPNITIEPISDGFDDEAGFAQAKNGDLFLNSFRSYSSKTLSRLIERFERSDFPVTCIVYNSGNTYGDGNGSIVKNNNGGTGKEAQASGMDGSYKSGTEGSSTNKGQGQKSRDVNYNSGDNSGNRYSDPYDHNSGNTSGGGKGSIVNNNSGGSGKEAKARPMAVGNNSGTKGSFTNKESGVQNFRDINYNSGSYSGNRYSDPYDHNNGSNLDPNSGYTSGGDKGSIVNKYKGGPGKDAQAILMADGYKCGTQGSFTNNGSGFQNFRDINYNSGIYSGNHYSDPYDHNNRSNLDHNKGYTFGGDKGSIFNSNKGGPVRSNRKWEKKLR